MQIMLSSIRKAPFCVLSVELIFHHQDVTNDDARGCMIWNHALNFHYYTCIRDYYCTSFRFLFIATLEFIKNQNVMLSGARLVSSEALFILPPAGGSIGLTALLFTGAYTLIIQTTLPFQVNLKVSLIILNRCDDACTLRLLLYHLV